MTSPAVAFDGGSALTNQPANIDVKHRKPPEEVANNGGTIGLSWSRNRTITMTWKDDEAHSTYAELVAARNSKRAHTVAFTLPSGSAYGTVKVDWANDPDFSIVTGQVFGDIVVELNERPD